VEHEGGEEIGGERGEVETKAWWRRGTIEDKTGKLPPKKEHVGDELNLVILENIGWR
jgi:hypothetical protein